jgi:hypothetical protein
MSAWIPPPPPSPGPTRRRHRGARLRRAGPLVAALLALAPARPAEACSVCGCGDPLLSASDPAAVNGGMRLQLDAEYLTVSAANHDAPALRDTLRQYTLRLNAVYSPLPALSVIAVLPYTRKDLATSGVTASDVSGIGDVEVGARLTLLDLPDFGARRRNSLAVSAGTSIPSGSNDVRVAGNRIDEHGQLGTGAWSPYAGLHYWFEQDRVTAFASVTGRLRTTSALGYQYGNALLWSLHGQYALARSLVLDAGVDGRHAAADVQHPAANPSHGHAGTIDDTGGTVLAASPAVYWNAGGPLWLAARAQLPFWSDLRGVQSVGPTVVVGVQYLVF